MKTNRNGAMLRTALLVGTLDGLAGMGLYYRATGRNPIGVFPYIASGVFGKAAFEGNGLMIVAGVLFHYFIAFCFTLFFFWIYPKWSALHKNRILVGILYGIFVWAVMNLLVVPLSNTPKSPFNPVSAVINAVVLMLSVGLPVSFACAANTLRQSKITS